MSHFTGKKFGIETDYSKKLKWNNDKKYLLQLTDHLSQKGFFDKSVNNGMLKQHFSTVDKNTKNTVSKRFQSRLGLLFPAPSGYRCKERLFYKARNKMPQIIVLEKCGIEPNF